MMIKNKDGSTFALRGPNPLLKNQDKFKEFTLHNCKWEPEVLEDTAKKVVPAKSDFNIKEIKEPEEPEKPEEEKIEIVEKLDGPETGPTNPNVTRIHCLPVKIEKRVDDLYGEVRITSGYADPFIFEAIILDQADFVIHFWTNIDIIERNSIIYPMNKDKRWWKVNQRKQSEGGYLYDAIPSDIHPEFT